VGLAVVADEPVSGVVQECRRVWGRSAQSVAASGHNGGMLPVALLVAFLVVPIVEIYVIIQVGHVIGAWPTVALLVAESILGAWIVRREGRRAWRALTSTVRQGHLPERELVNAALVLVGGVLLLTPGFVTDVAGFLLVLPFTRPAVRWLLSAWVAHRVRVVQAQNPGMFGGLGGVPTGRPSPRPRGTDGTSANATGSKVVRGEVIEDEPDRRP
jgi:UPF0716 family protein affecting phage T7 exclusion